MALLRVDQIQVGMELAADVVDRNGQLLGRAGTEISDRELRLFRMWGVDELDIAGLAEEEVESATPALDPEVLARVEGTAQQLFQHCDLEHPFMQQMYQLSLQRLAQKERK